MKNLKSLLSLIFITSLFFACETDDNNTPTPTPSGGDSDLIKISGEGELIEKVVSLAAFNSVSNIGHATITINKGTNQKVTLKAQQNILDVLTYKASGNTLTTGIKDDYSIETDKGIFIDIETPKEIESISITGAGDVELNTGEQVNLLITITGAGDIEAFNTVVNNCEIIISGFGNCNVNVANSLDVTIAGVGKIKYKGAPAISENISGKGSISKMK